jgi:subtilisin family serine protease
MRVTTSRLLTALLATATATAATVTLAATAHADQAPRILGAGAPDAVPGSYIVVFKDGVTAHYRGSVRHVYTATIHGYAATMSAADAARVAADPGVAYVQQDRLVHTTDVQDDPPSWGLDRIDQRNLPYDQTYTYSTTASNVNAYIIDTGIRLTHQDFGGRARSGVDTVDNDDDATDCMGHGTHVAGTVGGSAYGVAKGVNLWAVRVLNCQGSGTDAQVIAGVDWVTAHAVKPAVANMSLGGEATPALDEAVQRSIASGVTYAIAAGNSGGDACDESPARTPEAITVGATNDDDSKAYFSNFGTCLDIFAPGVNITSDWLTSDTATFSASGTSMASPHVTGTAALYLATHPDATPQQVRDALVAQATPDKVTAPGAGSPNKLLYTDSGVTPPPPPPGCGTKTNDRDVPIADAGIAAGTPIRVAGCSGNAPNKLDVEVHVKHPYASDLQIDLIGPSGTAYRLKNHTAGGEGSDIDRTYTVDGSKEPNDGTWWISIQDRSEGGDGYLDSWSLHLREDT